VEYYEMQLDDEKAIRESKFQALVFQVRKEEDAGLLDFFVE